MNTVRRTESLPPLSPGFTDRGRGLADIKGVDPMDRRMELEKKEKYAQALRDQMNFNAESRRRTPDVEEAPNWGSDGRSFMMHGSGSADAFQLDPLSLGAGQRLTTASPGCSTPLPGSHVDPSWSAADKVAQVQDLMRQRVQAVQEEQKRQWDRMQAALQEQAGAARQAAEQAVQRQLEAIQSGHVAELKGAINEVATTRRECAAQAKRADALGHELASCRQALDKLEAAGGGNRALLESHNREIERLKGDLQRVSSLPHGLETLRQALEKLSGTVSSHMHQLESHAAEIGRLKLAHEDCARAHQECARFRAGVQREQQALGEAVAQLRLEQQDMASQHRSRLQKHDSDIEGLLRGRQEDARLLADAARDREAVSAAVAQFRRDLHDLNGRCGDVPALIRQLREELPRLAARAAREALELARPPDPPTPLPPSPSPSPLLGLPPGVSDQAYAILRDSDDKFHELPAIQNVVGRSPVCNVCVPGSQAISNKHASVDFSGDGKVSINDLGSRNGTFLNDHRVPLEAGLVLQSGDAVRLGTDGPCYIFQYGPAYYARWPREPEKVRERRTMARSPSPWR